jgi:outer membrane murein-binding lipoprotein Lpp
VSTWGARMDKRELEAKVEKLEMQLKVARTEVVVLQRENEELRERLDKAR